MLNTFIQKLASVLGVQSDLIRLAVCLVLSYPLCGVTKRLPDKHIKSRQMFVIAVSVFYLVGIFNMWWGLFVMISSSLSTYFFTHKYRKSPFMPWLNFSFQMMFLLANHMRAQLKSDYDPDVLDITGAQMVLVMKLSGFGWNVYDGTFPKSQLSEFQQDRAIKVHPSLLYFLSYTLFFPSILTGPSCDYTEFASWINMSMFNDYDAVVKPKRRIPSSSVPAFIKCMQGLMWIGLWILGTKYIDPQYSVTYEFSNSRSFVFRIFYLYLVGLIARLKYYGAWSISEGACILSGLGFNGKDPKTKRYRWDRLQNIKPLKLETAQNAHTFIGSWNLNTNLWLRNYVYLRVTPKGRKPGLISTLATFVTSAAWHGTRPGYYLTFITGAFLQNLGKSFRRHVRPIFLQADGVTPGRYKMAYNIVGWINTQLAFGYTVQPFILLDVVPSFTAWKSVYFYIHVAIIVLTFAFYGPPKKTVLHFLENLYPQPSADRNTKKLLNSEANRLRKLNSDLEELVTLGVPLPDLDHVDDEIREAAEEVAQLRKEITDKLNEQKKSAGKEAKKDAGKDARKDARKDAGKDAKKDSK